MGYLDKILGRKPTKQETADDATPFIATDQPSSSASQIVLDSSPSSSYGPPSIGSNIGASPLSTMMSSFPTDTAAGSSSPRMYDPYEGISQSVGVRKQVFKLPQQPEFLFEEEAAVRRRGWGENLQFYVGLGYITGGGGGMTAGLYRFATFKPEALGPDTMKLKTNRLLNSVGMYARPLANSCGILGLYFSLFDSLIFNQLDNQGLPESLSSVFAGALSGVVFRSPRGPRQALVAGAIGAVGGAGIVAARTVFPSL